MTENHHWVSGYDCQKQLTKNDLEVLYGITPETLSDIKYLLAILSLEKEMKSDE